MLFRSRTCKNEVGMLCSTSVQVNRCHSELYSKKKLQSNYGFPIKSVVLYFYFESPRLIQLQYMSEFPIVVSIFVCEEELTYSSKNLQTH